MKRQLHIVSFDLSGAREFGVAIHDPGIPRLAVVDYVPRSALIRANGHGQLEPVARVIFEIDPEAPKRSRRFVILPQDVVLEHPGPLEFVGIFTSPTNNARIAMYEVPDRDKIIEVPGLVPSA